MRCFISHSFFCFLLIELSTAASSSLIAQEASGNEKIRLQAIAYYSGVGANYDEIKAKELFQQASENGEPLAQMWIARLYFMGQCGFPRNIEHSQKIAKSVIERIGRLAAEKTSEAQFLLAHAYYVGLGVPKDMEKALQLYKSSAALLFPSALNNLGQLYLSRADSSQAYPWLLKAAQLGEVRAAHMLGKIYLSGGPVDLDEKKAFEYFSIAASKGFPNAMVSLAECYYGGIGTTEDMSQSFIWALKGAQKGNADAMVLTAWCYVNGDGVAQNEEEGVNWLFKAAEKENLGAMYGLGQAYFNGKGVNKDLKESFKWYLNAAEKGHEMAMFETAASYNNGEGVTQDKVKGCEWFIRSAETGYPLAMPWAAACYNEGFSVAVDKEKAFQWGLRAAEEGELNTMCELGKSYFYGRNFYGRDLPKDEKEAFKWFLRAAENDHIPAMHETAVSYYNGNGVAKDDVQAFQWVKKAAENEYVLSMSFVAVFYYHGYGVNESKDKAFEWFSKAAEKGDIDAMFYLGVMNYDGIGTHQDLNKGLAWLKKASDNGHEKAKQAYAVATNARQTSSTNRHYIAIDDLDEEPTDRESFDSNDDAWKAALLGFGVVILKEVLSNENRRPEGTKTCTKCDGKGEVECKDSCHTGDDCNGHWYCAYKKTIFSSLLGGGYYYKRCDRCGGSGKE